MLPWRLEALGKNIRKRCSNGNQEETADVSGHRWSIVPVFQEGSADFD